MPINLASWNGTKNYYHQSWPFFSSGDWHLERNQKSFKKSISCCNLLDVFMNLCSILFALQLTSDTCSFLLVFLQSSSTENAAQTTYIFRAGTRCNPHVSESESTMATNEKIQMPMVPGKKPKNIALVCGFNPIEEQYCIAVVEEHKMLTGT